MASPVQGALMQGQAQFEILTSKTPLSELAPVSLAGDDEQVYGEIDRSARRTSAGVYRGTALASTGGLVSDGAVTETAP